MDLDGADLTRAVLTGARLTRTYLADADLTGADLTRKECPANGRTARLGRARPCTGVRRQYGDRSECGRQVWLIGCAGAARTWGNAGPDGRYPAGSGPDVAVTAGMAGPARPTRHRG